MKEYFLVFIVAVLCWTVASLPEPDMQDWIEKEQRRLRKKYMKIYCKDCKYCPDHDDSLCDKSKPVMYYDEARGKPIRLDTEYLPISEKNAHNDCQDFKLLWWKKIFNRLSILWNT